MEKQKYTRSDCILLLQNKSSEIASLGEDRFPKRGDFTSEEVEAVKAHLGPWPRALEAAGLKKPREDDRKELNREKRIRSKRRRREALKESRKTASTDENG